MYVLKLEQFINEFKLAGNLFFHRIGLIGAIYVLSIRDGKAYTLTSFPLNEPKTWR